MRARVRVGPSARAGREAHPQPLGPASICARPPAPAPILTLQSRTTTANKAAPSATAPRAARPAVAARASPSPDAATDAAAPSSSSPSSSRRAALGATAAAALGLGLAAALPAGPARAAAPSAAGGSKVLSADWEQVALPVDKGVVLLDIGFTGSDPDHGFLLGTRQTLLETRDGGRTWQPRSVDAARDEGFNYRFQSISFAGDEGWIVGKPAILLRTTDGGTSWERVPLSNKLPGAPLLITALPSEGGGKSKGGQAELTTDQGAIYVTDNGAYTWTAAVQETVDATLNRTVSSGISGASYYEGSFSNVARAPNGDYVAVSSRGNFYMTWTPGQPYWQPHNRPAARRLQNMGWTEDGRLWVTTRGGDMLLAEGGGVAADKFANAKLSSRGFGLLDVSYASADVAFACGGSGSLYKSTDGGATWRRDRSADDVAGNLYAIKFSGPPASRHGFILGNDGILLRYIGSAGTAPGTA